MILNNKKMPVKIGSKTYKAHNSAAKAIAKKKGLPIDRAHAYVAVVERKQRGGSKKKK
jgi:hypothetical protein